MNVNNFSCLFAPISSMGNNSNDLSENFDSEMLELFKKFNLVHSLGGWKLCYSDSQGNTTCYSLEEVISWIYSISNNDPDNFTKSCNLNKIAMLLNSYYQLKVSQASLLDRIRNIFTNEIVNTENQLTSINAKCIEFLPREMQLEIFKHLPANEASKWNLLSKSQSSEFNLFSMFPEKKIALEFFKKLNNHIASEKFLFRFNWLFSLKSRRTYKILNRDIVVEYAYCNKINIQKNINLCFLSKVSILENNLTCEENFEVKKVVEVINEKIIERAKKKLGYDIFNELLLDSMNSLNDKSSSIKNWS